MFRDRKSGRVRPFGPVSIVWLNGKNLCLPGEKFLSLGKGGEKGRTKRPAVLPVRPPRPRLNEPERAKRVPGSSREGGAGRSAGQERSVQKGGKKPSFCMKRPEKKKAGGETAPVRPLPEGPAQALRRVFSWILSGSTDRPRPPRPAVQALGAKRGPLFPAPSGRVVQAFRGVKFSKMMLSIRSFF